jgi:hypothetical protein
MQDHTPYSPKSDAAGRGESPAVFPFQKPDVYELARQLAALVQRMNIRDAELRDQATRASQSAFLNLRGAARRSRRHAPQVLRAGGRLAP